MSSVVLKKIIMYTVIFLISFALIVTALSFIYFNKTTIYSKVAINGIDVSGLNRIEAMEKLRSSFTKAFKNKNLVLVYDGYKHIVSYEDLGIQYDYYKGVNNGFKIGRQGNAFKKLIDILDCRINGRNISLELVYEKVKLDKLIENIKKDLNKNSENAKIQYDNWRFSITPEVIGKKVQEDLLRHRIINSILDNKEIRIPVKSNIPKITEEILKEIQYPISEFTTYFASSSQGRKNNIKISSIKVNGSVVLPNEVFSFNKSTGERTRNTGYMESKVIMDGRFVPDIGGGVCQVSTTLYNAVLRANLEIVERHPHSIPVRYVQKGKDAAVSYGYLDLKFRNSYEFPIYVQAKVTSSAVTFRIFGGKVNENRQTNIISILQETINPEIEKHIDNSLIPGSMVIVQKGRYGYKVNTYKVIYEDGQEIKRELISNDFYKPKKYILRVGPKTTIESILQIENSGGKLVQ